MPYDVDIDHEAGMITVAGSGRATTADTLAFIADNEDTFLACPGYAFLYDLSRLSIESTPSDLVQVTTALFGRGMSFRRFAIVVPEQGADLARMFAALAQPFGVTANVFVDRQDALSWLGAGR